MNLPSDIAYRMAAFDPALVEARSAMLSEEERRQVQQFKSEQRRNQYILGRVAVRTLLAERLDLRPDEVPLSVLTGGGLEVAGHPYSVSVAHTGPCAVAVVALRPVGIDLERITPRRPDLHRFLLHPDEQPLWESAALDHTRTQVLFWTLKEATLKARHSGFRFSPKKLKLEIDFCRNQAVVLEPDGTQWRACFEERDGMYLAISFSELVALRF